VATVLGIADIDVQQTGEYIEVVATSKSREIFVHRVRLSTIKKMRNLTEDTRQDLPRFATVALKVPPLNLLKPNILTKCLPESKAALLASIVYHIENEMEGKPRVNYFMMTEGAMIPGFKTSKGYLECPLRDLNDIVTLLNQIEQHEPNQ